MSNLLKNLVLCSGASEQLRLQLKLADGGEFQYLARHEDMQKIDKNAGLYIARIIICPCDMLMRRMRFS